MMPFNITGRTAATKIFDFLIIAENIPTLCPPIVVEIQLILGTINDNYESEMIAYLVSKDIHKTSINELSYEWVPRQANTQMPE